MKRQPSGSEQITHGIILLCFLLPLIFFPGLISLYRLPKSALLAFFSAVLCWLWAGSHFRHGKEGASTLPLLAPLLVFLFIAALSLFRSINPYEGANFLFQTISGVSLFWITSTHFETGKLGRFFHWSAIAAGVVSVLGIAQAWGADIPTLIAVSGPGSTFGNKNMAAQYLLFVLPTVFYLLLCSTNPSREWAYALLAGLITSYFVYTGTRAAWGGAMVGLIGLLTCLALGGRLAKTAWSIPMRKWAFLVGIGAFVITMNVVPPYLFRGFAAQPPRAQLESMLEVEAEGRDRFAIWANSLAVFADHPILGAGKGTFRFIYPVYARRAIEDRSFSPQARAADAHNDYIQLLAETGVLGATSFLLILVFLALRLWRGLRQNFDPKLLVVGFALVAILAEAFWDFPFNLPVPVAFFWIYAGMLWQLTQTDATKDHRPPKLLSSFTIVLATLVATLFSILTVSSLRGEFYYSRAARKAYEGRLGEAEKDLTKATQINPLNYRYHFLLGLVLIKTKEYGKAAESIRHSLSLDPYNINALNNLGVAYASAGDTPKAAQAFQTALRIWPRYIEPQKSLGFIYAREGEREKAIRYFQAVLALDASDRQARDSLLALGVIPPGHQR